MRRMRVCMSPWRISSEEDESVSCMCPWRWQQSIEMVQGGGWMPSDTLHYNTLNSSALHCSAVKCRTVQCSAVQCSAVLHGCLYGCPCDPEGGRCHPGGHTELHCIASSKCILYCIVLQCTVFYCTVLYCTAMYCTALRSYIM